MAEQDEDSKTEEPTGKRLTTAREEGDITQSQEVKTAAMLTTITILVWFVLPPAMGHVRNYLAALLAEPHLVRVGTEDELMILLREMSAHVGLAMLAPFAMLLVIALISSFGQTGWLITFSKITPDISKLNPLKGLSRIFSMPGLVEFVKNISKMTLVAVLFFFVLRPKIVILPVLPSMDLPAILDFLHSTLVRLLVTIAFVDIVIAAADYMFQRYSMMKRLRMTKQEVKDEHKQSDGDPMIKARIRAMRAQRARQRMMAAVPRADVVVTNPTHYACALKYDPDSMNAPVLVAKGQDSLALRIREVAEQHDISIIENPPLARALYAAVEIDKEIPPEHYKAVAEVISYVFRLKGKLRR